MVKTWRAAVLLILVWPVSGCSIPQIVGKGGNLKLTCWELTGISGTPMPPPDRPDSITLGFDVQAPGAYQGHTRSNDYWGSYSTNAREASISGMGMTMVGESPEGEDFIRLLPLTASYTAANNHLTLFDSSGVAILDFKAARMSSCAFTGPPYYSNPNEKELREFFDQYMLTLQQAYLTGDTSKLSEVIAVQDLGQTFESVRNRTQGSRLPAEDFKVSSFKVLAYETGTASFEVEYAYRYFGIDPATGDFDFSGSWYFHTANFSLVMENGSWKVQDVRTISWAH